MIIPKPRSSNITAIKLKDNTKIKFSFSLLLRIER